MHLVSKALDSIFLDGFQHFFRMGLQLVDAHGVGRVVRQGDHALLGAQIHGNHGIVVGHGARLELFVCLGPAMHLKVILHLVVRDPDGTEASGFGGHDINTVAEVDGQLLYAGAGKFQHLVLHKTALEGGLH